MPFSITRKQGTDAPDRELIARLQQGGHLALNALMARYKERLYRFVRRYIPDDDAAYDIVQETFIRVYYKAESYDDAYAFSTWLYQIAINLCRDQARKQRLPVVSLDRPVYGGEEGDYHELIADLAPNAEQLASSRQALARLEQEIHLLPHKLKTALILYAVEDHSQEECAALLGTTPKTIETRVYRARKILAKKLGQ